MVMHFAESCLKTLTTMKNQILNFVIIIVDIVAPNAVYWVLKTPVVFGGNATLTCMVERKENCDSKATRRWDGGRNKSILLLNGYSSNDSKYYEIADQPCANFSLVIMDFRMSDVNWEYGCTFEFETSIRMLTLDARYFIGAPSKDDLSFSLEQKQTNLSLEIQFHRVYPIPKCTVKIEHEYWFDNFTDSQPNGLFFNATLQISTNLQSSQCHKNVTGICTLLSLTVLQFDNILNCTESSTQFGPTHMTLISVGIVAVFLILVTVTVLCVVQCRNKLKDETRSSSILKTNDQTCTINQEECHENCLYHSSIDINSDAVDTDSIEMVSQYKSKYENETTSLTEHKHDKQTYLKNNEECRENDSSKTTIDDISERDEGDAKLILTASLKKSKNETICDSEV